MDPEEIKAGEVATPATPPILETPWFETAKKQLSDLGTEPDTRSLKDELAKTVDVIRKHNIRWLIFIFDELPSMVAIVIEAPQQLYRAIVRFIFVATRVLLNIFTKTK